MLWDTRKPSNYIFGDVVAYDFDLFLKFKDSNEDHFSTLNVVISKTVTNRANKSIVDTQEVAYRLSNGNFTFDQFQNITIADTGSHLLAFKLYIYI